MNMKRALISGSLAVVILFTTGCFQVGSETRALRDAALEIGALEAEEKIEFGVGFFTVGLAKLGTRFVDMPPEVKDILGSVDGAECSVYDVRGGTKDMAKILREADKAMDKRGFDRVVGVVERRQLVAVYIPRNVKSHRNLSISVLVLDEKQLVCATARGDLEPVVQLALNKTKVHLPPRTVASVL